MKKQLLLSRVIWDTTSTTCRSEISPVTKGIVALFLRLTPPNRLARHVDCLFPDCLSNFRGASGGWILFSLLEKKGCPTAPLAAWRCNSPDLNNICCKIKDLQISRAMARIKFSARFLPERKEAKIFAVFLLRTSISLKSTFFSTKIKAITKG